MFEIRFAWHIALALAFASGMLQPARAQFGPTAGLHIVVPYAAGGTGDMIARTLADPVGRALGSSVVVDDKPGGATVIGTQSVAAAPAGQEVLLIAASFVINPHLMPKLPYDAARDFVPVTLMASNPHVLVVSNTVPASNLAEFIAWARKSGGAATYASFGNGSSGHLGFEMLKMEGRFSMIHVPYKGSAPAMNDLLGGQVNAMLTDLPAAIQYIKAGRLKAIAISGEERAPSLPNVPTFAEGGLLHFESRSWYGLLARAGTPPARIEALRAAFVAALRDPAVHDLLVRSGLDISATGPVEFGAFMQRESQRYGEVIRHANVKLE